jgi:hypothetical protein
VPSALPCLDHISTDLVRIVEGRKLGVPVDLLDQSVNRLLRYTFLALELVQLSLCLHPLPHLAKHLRKEGALLTSDLGGGCIGRSGAVSDSVHSIGTIHGHEVVDLDTSTLRLCPGQLGHEVPGNLARSVTGRPDQKTVWNLAHLLVGILNDDPVGLDILDHRTGKNINLVFFERGLGVLDELLGECGQDIRESFDEGDPQSVGNFRVPLAKIILIDKRETQR